MNGLRLKKRAHVGGEGELEEDVAHGARRAAAGSTARRRAPTEKSDTGPAALIAIRRRRGSNHASEVSTNAYGKTNSSLSPAFSTVRPNDAIASPCAISWTATTRSARRRNTSAAEPDLRRDHERRAVAPDDQVGEARRCPATTSTAERDQRRLGEQHPAAAPVEPLEEGAEPVEGLHARPEQPSQQALGRRVLPAASRPRDAGRKPRSPRSASRRASRGRPGRRRSAARRTPIRSTSERVPSSSSKSCASLSDSRRKVFALEVAQHPALGALVGLEPLERVARAHPRPHPELGRPARHARPAQAGHDQARARRARRSCGPPPCASRRRSTRSSLVAEPDRAPSRSAIGPAIRAPSTNVPCARARVLDHAAPPPLPPRCARARARPIGSSSTHGASPARGRSSSRRRPAPASGRRARARAAAACPASGAAAGAAESASPRELAPAARAEHRRLPQRQRLEGRVVAREARTCCCRTAGRAGIERARRCVAGKLVGLHDHELAGRRGATPPCRRARASAWRSVSRKSSLAWRGRAGTAPPPWLETSASRLPSGEIAASSTPSFGLGDVGHELALAPVLRVGRERLLRAPAERCRTRPA